MNRLHFGKSHNFLVMLAFCLVLLTAQASHAVTTTFANFSTTGGGRPYVFTNNTASATFNTVPAGANVRFFYDEFAIAGLDPSLQGQQNAVLTMTSSTTTPATLTLGNISQPLETVTIAIIRTTAAPVGMGTRRNLLTMTITTGSPNLTGSDGGGSASFDASTPSENVVFTSDFLNFAATVGRDVGLSFSGASPVLSIGAGGFLTSLATTGTGTFASDPVPVPFSVLAASATIGGRVFTANGSPIRNATVVLSETNGTFHVARSSSLGFYSFSDIPVGQSVTISVPSKRYSFSPQLLSVFGDQTDLDLYADQ